MYFGPSLYSHPPTSDDPRAYPRSVKIVDGDALMLISEIERVHERRMLVRRQLLDLTEQDSVLSAEINLAHARLFQRLRALHADVAADSEHGWRKFEDDFWFVGW